MWNVVRLFRYNSNMRKMILGLLLGISGTRAAIKTFDFVTEIRPDMTFLEVMELSVWPVLLIAATLVCAWLIGTDIQRELKESNDAIKRAKEELKQKNQ